MSARDMPDEQQYLSHQLESLALHPDDVDLADSDHGEDNAAHVTNEAVTPLPGQTSPLTHSQMVLTSETTNTVFNSQNQSSEASEQSTVTNRASEAESRQSDAASSDQVHTIITIAATGGAHEDSDKAVDADIEEHTNEAAIDTSESGTQSQELVAEEVAAAVQEAIEAEDGDLDDAGHDDDYDPEAGYDYNGDYEEDDQDDLYTPVNPSKPESPPSSKDNLNLAMARAGCWAKFPEWVKKDLMTQLMEVTDVDSEKALQYLEIADGKIDMAIELLMENDQIEQIKSGTYGTQDTGGGASFSDSHQGQEKHRREPYED